MRARNETSSSAFPQFDGEREVMRSVSRKMNPRRWVGGRFEESSFEVSADEKEEKCAVRYSATECWDPRGLDGEYQDRKGRCVAGKR